MNKNIIIVILAILLAVSVGYSVYLNQSKVASEEGGVKILDSEKSAFQNEKTDLQKKIDKGFVYAQALDLLLEPARKQSGIPTRQNLSDTEWIVELTNATKETSDGKLLNNLKGITDGGDGAQLATILFMEYTASMIVDTLK